MSNEQIAVRQALRVRNLRDMRRRDVEDRRTDARAYRIAAKHALRKGFPHVAARYVRLYLRVGGDILWV